MSTVQNILVVGVGTSGSEIARDIIPYAKKVYASSKVCSLVCYPQQGR